MPEERQSEPAVVIVIGPYPLYNEKFDDGGQGLSANALAERVVPRRLNYLSVVKKVRCLCPLAP